MIDDLLVRRPFTRVRPDFKPILASTTDAFKKIPLVDDCRFDIVTPSQFIREYFPSGHLINDRVYYKDKIKYDEETKRHFTQEVVRVSFPFQYIIAAQQIVHLCGNDIHHELSASSPTEAEVKLLREFNHAWLSHNMEISMYWFVKSVKIVGDAAMVIFLDENGHVGSKVLSYLEGDSLYPHYDSISGKLNKFVRKYSDYNENGDEITTWLEVWDSRRLTRYRRDNTGIRGKIARAKDMLNLNSYTEVESVPHGFNEVPVAYMRADIGACWSLVQDCIDKFELAVSHLCQNNMAYAFPIMVLKGDSVEVQGDIYGDVKAITMGANDEASYLSSPQASEAFRLQLDYLLKMIFLGSFTVMPPEVKSGDLPGVSIKLIYSPSLERAIIDAKEFDPALDTIVRLFKRAYGVESKQSSAFETLPVFSWIEPYIHSNTAELIQNLATSVQNGFLSRATASELSTFGINGELDRIITEKKEQDASELLFMKADNQPAQINNNNITE